MVSFGLRGESYQLLLEDGSHQDFDRQEVLTAGLLINIPFHELPWPRLWLKHRRYPLRLLQLKKLSRN